MKPIVPKNWYLVRKNTDILIVDSACSRRELDIKLLEMDDPDKYEIIHRDEVYRRIKG
jgi:hypothetical protein